MNLESFIKYFREGGNLKGFCENQFLDYDSEVIMVYIKQPFDINSKVKPIELEKTHGKSLIEIDNEEFGNLFDMYWFQEFIEESNFPQNKSKSNKELAEVLINYAINDA